MGSPPLTNTIGMVWVERLAASAAGGRRSEDHRNLALDEISGKLRQSLRPAVGRPVLNRHVLPLREALLA